MEHYHNRNWLDSTLPADNVLHCVFGPAKIVDNKKHYYLNGELIGIDIANDYWHNVRDEFVSKTSRYYLKDGSILNGDEYNKLCKELYPNSINPSVPSKSLHRLDGPAEDLFNMK